VDHLRRNILRVILAFAGKDFQENFGIFRPGAHSDHHRDHHLPRYLALLCASIEVPVISGITDPAVIQEAISQMMEDLRFREFTQVSSLISVIFLVWSANLWIFDSNMPESHDETGCSDGPYPGRHLYSCHSGSAFTGISLPGESKCAAYKFHRDNLCICAILAVPVMAQDDSAAAAQVAVTNVIIDPAFLRRHTGIINVEITNNGAQSVAIRRATIYGGEVTVLSQSYDTTTVIGAGNRMTFSLR